MGGKMQKLHIIFEIIESSAQENAEITHYVRNNGVQWSGK